MGFKPIAIFVLGHCLEDPRRESAEAFAHMLRVPQHDPTHPFSFTPPALMVLCHKLS
jgi:hypothetical protein